MAAKKEARNAKKAAKAAMNETPAMSAPALPAQAIPAPAVAPVITEDDLLNFQFAHFGDDSKPEDWFVDPQTALTLQQEYTEEEEEGALGYYPDGAKRTLTDEQIKMFRHSEIQEILRKTRLEEDGDETESELGHARAEQEAPNSPSSDTSSLEGDLFSLTKPAAKLSKRSDADRHQPQHLQQAQSQRSRSASSRSTGQPGAGKRRRRQEVPYDERHKRKWEDYIEDNDPIEGSMTFRRLVRELDDRQEEPIDMDY